MITTQKLNPNLWIPSINRIDNLLIGTKNDKTLLKASFANIQLNILELKRNICGKVILVDYPFLKPFIVKDIMHSPADPNIIKKILEKKKIQIKSSKNLLFVSGHLIVFSSTDHTSLSISPKIKYYPYCLTAPLLPELTNALDILNVKPLSNIEKPKRVAIVKEGKFVSLGEMLEYDNNLKKAKIQFLDYEGPPAPTGIAKRSFVLYEQQLIACKKFLPKVADKEPEIISYSNLLKKGTSIKENQDMQIWSRVISVGSGGPIPPMEFGTVINIDKNKKLIAVIMDNEFRLGSTFHMQLKTKRGIIAKFNDFFLVSDQ